MIDLEHPIHVVYQESCDEYVILMTVDRSSYMVDARSNRR